MPTKIMTAIIALEKGYIKSRVKVSPRAASVGGSSFHLSTGEVLSLENMLYGLLLPSGNDASIAIAEHIGGTEENFVHMMNEKALELGALILILQTLTALITQSTIPLQKTLL